MNYDEFLKTKIEQFKPCGFDCEPSNENLFDFQRAIVKIALKRGKSALFLDTGLGKTICQLSWADEVYKHTGKNVLILAPLAVSVQTKREGEKFGIDVNICRMQEDVKEGINITNYEMLEHFNADEFIGIVLDESSILKSYSGKMKTGIIEKFENVPYKLSCTATPSPNDTMELLNQAEFLNVLKSHEALAVWFVTDQNSMGAYRLKHHAEDDFWTWVSSWAVLLKKPSDLGFNDDGYDLPPLHEKDVIIPVSLKSEEKGRLLRKVEMSATNFYKEKKLITEERIKKIAEIANSTDEQYLIWCDTNEESSLLHKAIEGSVEVKGSDKPEHKEKSSLDFKSGKIRVLISKVSIFGFGLNFQNCTKCIFCGLNYSYEKYYQAVRRLYRFGQTKEVTVYRVLGSTESHILNILTDKYRKQENMQEHMNKCTNKLILDEMNGNRKFKLSEQNTENISFPSWLKEETYE